MFTYPDKNKISAHRLQCNQQENYQPKDVPGEIVGEEINNIAYKKTDENPSNAESINQKTDRIKNAHKKPPSHYKFFGAEDLSMGLGNLIAFYLITRAKSIPTDKIVDYFIKNPHLLGKYFPKDDFYFPQFILWIGICGVIFGIRCILLPERWPKGFLIVHDVFFSLLMLSIPAYSTLKYLTPEAIFNFMFFLIAWGILFFFRIYLLHKSNYYTKRCD